MSASATEGPWDDAMSLALSSMKGSGVYPGRERERAGNGAAVDNAFLMRVVGHYGLKRNNRGTSALTECSFLLGRTCPPPPSPDRSRAICNARLIVRVDLMKGINLARAAFISIPCAARPLRFVLDFNQPDDSESRVRRLNRGNFKSAEEFNVKIVEIFSGAIYFLETFLKNHYY